MAEDSHVLEAGHAPTPFTAAEIRDATTVGKSITRRVESVGAEPFLLISTYVECDESGATLERSQRSLDGAPLGEPQVMKTTWLDLQRHASFTADGTTIEPERIETAIGALDCLRYTVRDGGTDEIFWFATSLPGMPIQQLTRTDGRIVASVSVVDYTAS
ncbi:hypothetical protein [Kribbella sp. VKM Ac-2566]|uniref:hypothetical protein n=1 Tax=Kribbella sp. VKM Ac-2566 TaxID=2512218 RepID=UPI0010636431|nr:hypothetical protein [Kribbella sp. VKM Ac-2566]TDW86586.1 hypothetical protein EV647_6683 [Kribbella sp. VKM Ac-2566]